MEKNNNNFTLNTTDTEIGSNWKLLFADINKVSRAIGLWCGKIGFYLLKINHYWHAQRAATEWFEKKRGPLSTLVLMPGGGECALSISPRECGLEALGGRLCVCWERHDQSIDPSARPGSSSLNFQRPKIRRTWLNFKWRLFFKAYKRGRQKQQLLFCLVRPTTCIG